jgi:hypothetical protein
MTGRKNNANNNKNDPAAIPIRECDKKFLVKELVNLSQNISSYLSDARSLVQAMAIIMHDYLLCPKGEICDHIKVMIDINFNLSKISDKWIEESIPHFNSKYKKRKVNILSEKEDTKLEIDQQTKFEGRDVNTNDYYQ